MQGNHAKQNSNWLDHLWCHWEPWRPAKITCQSTFNKGLKSDDTPSHCAFVLMRKTEPTSALSTNVFGNPITQAIHTGIFRENNMEYEFNTHFLHPFAMIVTGNSGSGKTFFTKKLIQDKVDPELKRIFWYYGEWPEGYFEMPSNVHIIPGIPESLDIYIGPKCLLSRKGDEDGSSQ